MNPQLFFRVHAVQRMFERKVSVKKVSQALQSGEIIEDYSSEMPEPSRLILGFQGKRPFHVVTSENMADERNNYYYCVPSRSTKMDEGFQEPSSMNCLICRQAELVGGLTSVHFERK